MKKISTLFLFLLVSDFVNAQDIQQQKIDSVFRLIVKHFNQKNDSALYNLTGNQFRKMISFEDFKATNEKTLFALGTINDSKLDSCQHGNCEYFISFDSRKGKLGLSLDDKDKLLAFYITSLIDKHDAKGPK